MVTEMNEHSTEYVTYRELTSVLDSRDARLIAEHHDLARRIERLDTNGSRALQRMTDKLEATVEALERHDADHKETAKRTITARQWWVTTAFGFIGILLALWAQLPH